MDPRNEPTWNRPKLEAVPAAASSSGAGTRTPAASEPKGISHGQLAWSQKYLILGFMLGGLAAAFAYVVYKSPLYMASTTLEMIGANQSFLGMSQVDPQAGTDALSASQLNIQTQLRILQSRTLISRTVERMNLELTPGTNVPATLFSRLRGRIAGRPVPTVQSRIALQLAAGTLTAKSIPATRLIEIQCMSTSPEVAASFVNTLVSEHVLRTSSARSNLTQNTSQFMDSQLEEAKFRVQQANDKLRAFVQQPGMDFFPEQNTLADTKMKTLQGDLGKVEADRIAKQTRYELVKNTPLANLPDVLNDPSLETLKYQLAGLQRDMNVLLTTLTPENLRVKKVQAQIDQTQATLDSTEAAIAKRIQTDYEEALRQEKLLMGAYNGQTRSVSAQSDKAAQYAALKQDLETQDKIYNSLLLQANQAALVAVAPTSPVRVVDAASPPSRPTTPNPVKDIPTGGLAGAAVGYGLLWIREIARGKKRLLLFQTPGHTRSVLGVPELGVIPSVQQETPKRWLLQRALRPSGKSNSLLRVASDNGNLMTGNSTDWQMDRSSLLSESFRQTLVSLLRMKPTDHAPVYVITSAGPGEGKTTLSANLARAMAEIGHRVLLLDADLRRPQMHTMFGEADQKGLSDVLTTSDLKQLKIDEFIQSTPVNNLSVITHGIARVETPALLLFSPKIKDFVRLLQSRFDCILFDTAPCLPFPDARLWGRYADGIVLVVRAGMTTQQGATDACQIFQNDGIPVLGTLFNDWTAPPEEEQAYYAYSHRKDAI